MNIIKKTKIKKKQIYISDRRWRKIIRLLRTPAFLNGRNQVDFTDCFLIKYCIWNEIEQIPAVFQFVKDAIQKHSFSFNFSLDTLINEINNLKNEIENETLTLKEQKVLKEYIIKTTFFDYQSDDKIKKYNFYKVKSKTHSEVFYLNIDDYKRLTYEPINLYMLRSLNINDKMFFLNVTKGKDNYHITINGIEYELESENKIEKTIKKPHKKVVEEWNNRINNLLEFTKAWKDKINDIINNNNIENLRKNLFVNFNDTDFMYDTCKEKLKEIEKIEIEITSVKNSYTNIN